MLSFEAIVRRVFFFTLCCLATALPSIACPDGAFLPLGESVSWGYIAAGEGLVFEIDVPAPGILHIESAAGLDSAAPALARIGACAGFESADSRTLFQGLGRQTLRVEAGRHLFKVAAQDLSRPLHRLRLRADLHILNKVEEDPDEIDVDPDPFQAPALPCLPTKEEDPDEIDVDPDPFQVPASPCFPTKEEDPDEIDVDPDPFHSPTLPCLPMKEEDPDEIDVDPDPFQAPTSACFPTKEEDPDEIDVDPDPFSGGGSESLRRRIRLGQTGGSGLWKVQIDHAGARLALSDQLGRRLAVGSASLSRLLLPGEYWLEVEMDGQALARPSIQITAW